MWYNGPKRPLCPRQGAAARRTDRKGERHMADTWEALERDCGACRACALAETRTNVVFGDGAKEDRKSTRLNSSH